MQRWSLEWGGAAQLAWQGVHQQTLKVGDHVVITGRPSRTPGEYRVLVQTIARPSQWLQLRPRRSRRLETFVSAKVSGENPNSLTLGS